GDQLRNKDITISSKVGRILKPGAVAAPMDYGMVDPMPFHPVYDYSYDGIMRSFENGLQRLGLERIDILLAHDIGEFQHGEENDRHFGDLKKSGYKAMAELREQGLVKAIG
ncbi:MAG: aldo/keto reductase, partial [Paracoccaceae bacterium]